MRTTLLIAAALLVLANPVQAAPGPDAVVACMIGQVAMALRKNHDHWSKLDAFEATEAAQRYAAKRCKGSGIGEGNGDFVYNMIRAMALTMHDEDGVGK
jgi:hypothetical protein